jgi:hypothetical protein
MEEKIINVTENKLKEIIDHIDGNNIEYVYKLSKIRHMAKEDENMRYNDYNAYNDYGRYDDYGARRRDSRGRYRGQEQLDRMYDDYGRYMDSRSRYGTGEDTDKSFYYMVKALEDFIRVLNEEADSPQQKQQLRETLQKSMM